MHTMYFSHIHPSSSFLIPLRSTPTADLNSQTTLLITGSSLCCSRMQDHKAIHWSMIKLPVNIVLNAVLPFFNLRITMIVSNIFAFENCNWMSFPVLLFAISV